MPAFQQGLRRNEGMYYVKATEGLDSLRTDLGIGPKADITQNLRFSTEVGAVSKRAAVSYYNSAVESSHPESIYRYYREANNTGYMLGLFNTTLRGSVDGTFYTISSTILANSGGRKFTAVTYNDLAIISTGYDNIIQTDGVYAWELGSCKAALNTDATPAQVTAGTHYYAVVFVIPTGFTINGAHSNTVTNGAANTSNTLSYIPLGPDGCTARRIYRTAAGGSTLKLLYTIPDNSTQTYTDITPDGTLGADMAAINSDMPRGLYLYVEQERLFVAHDVTAGIGRKSTVYYSDQYIPQYINTETADMSTTQAANNYEVITPDDNDIITGIINQLGVTYVFKQNNIRPWSVSGTPEVWEVGQIVSTIGCPAPYTLQNSPQGIIYQGWDRMYLFNGQYSQNIMDDFSFDENFLDSSRASNVGFFWNNLYLLSYADANAANSYNDRVLVYDIIRKQTSIDKGGPLASGVMNVGCFAAFRGGDDWGTLYAGDSVLGWIYQYDRTINSNQVNTQSGFNLGTHTGTYAAPPEENTILGGVVLDNMEAYATDVLVQAAWQTSVTAASKKVPPYLGTGIDGAVTISTATTLSSTMNYTSLIVDPGITLTISPGVNIYCLGTITNNGTITSTSSQIAAHTIINAGTITGVIYLSSNTLNNTGTLTLTPIDQGSNIVPDATHSNAPTDALAHDGDFDTTYTISCSGDGASASGYSTHVWSGTKYLTQVRYRFIVNATTSAGASSNTAAAQAYVQLSTDGGATFPTTIVSTPTASASGNQTTTIDTGIISLTGNWAVNAIRANLQCQSDKECNPACGGSQSAYTAFYEIEAYAGEVCAYVNSTGTVPISGSVATFVNPLEVYSNTDTVYQGTYSLQAVCTPGADTLNGTITKTLPQTFDLTARDSILIDVWSLRTGTNIEFALVSGITTTYKDIVVSAAQTWQTYQLNFTGATKNAVATIKIRFKDTTSGNIIYMDNIRPSSYAVTPISYLSARFTINAQSMGQMYWNEVLTTAGTIKVYTRTGDNLTDYTNWTDDTGWSAALTNPAGSVIASTARTYFQFKVTFESTDTTGINFPYIYNANGYNMKFTYWKVSATAENSVEFIYRTGWRNFDQPFDDKIYRKLITLHEGSEGYFTAQLESDENDTQTTFNNNQPYPTVLQPSPFQSVSLTQYPNRWYTTLPDYMYGKELRLTIYKNDNYAYRLRQYGVMIETIGLI